MTQAMQYEKPQLQKKSLTELRKLINLRLPGQYTDAELKQINGKNKDKAIDYFLQKIRQEEQHKDDNDDDDDDQYALAPDHPNFKKSLYNDDNFGLDSSRLNNSRFEDLQYDNEDDNEDLGFVDTSLMNAFKDLDNLIPSTPPKVFTKPKQMPFTDQSASSTSMTTRVAKYDDDDDDLDFSNDPVYGDINEGWKDLFYTPISDAAARATPVKPVAKTVAKTETKADKKAQAKKASSISVAVPVPQESGGGGAVIVKKKKVGRPKKEQK
jgi:hypothetical protein